MLPYPCACDLSQAGSQGIWARGFELGHEMDLGENLWHKPELWHSINQTVYGSWILITQTSHGSLITQDLLEAIINFLMPSRWFLNILSNHLQVGPRGRACQLFNPIHTKSVFFSEDRPQHLMKKFKEKLIVGTFLTTFTQFQSNIFAIFPLFFKIFPKMSNTSLGSDIQ